MTKMIKLVKYVPIRQQEIQMNCWVLTLQQCLFLGWERNDYLLPGAETQEEPCCPVTLIKSLQLILHPEVILMLDQFIVTITLTK